MTPVRAAFLTIAAACLIPIVPPWAALLAGIGFALTLGNPYPAQSKSVSKLLLQVCVVLLGFSMDLNTILKAGSEGILFALVSIVCVFLLGWGAQRLLKLPPIAGLLVSTGTAICGGSAIAAMSTVVDAKQEDVSVAVGTVFILNAIALLIFPPLGHALHLSQHQFGTWAGIAIHDVASVVGAGKAYGAQALEIGTAVKLSRVLYLIPITLFAAWLVNRKYAGEGAVSEARSKPTFPWFILGFLGASILRSYVPGVVDFAPQIKILATMGLSVALYLIGAGISRATLKQVGVKPLVHGVILWAFISVVSLLVVLRITN